MLPFKTYLFITREKKLRQQYKINKFEIIIPMWNDAFELPDSFCSVTDNQDYNECIIENTKHYPQVILFIFLST